MSDPINPAHYKDHYKGIEVIQLTEQMNFNRGNAVKYVARAGIKDASTELEDLRKAAWYIDREIARLQTAGSGTDTTDGLCHDTECFRYGLRASTEHVHHHIKP